MEDLRVTGIQCDIYWEDKSANFEALENQYLHQIKTGETDLIILPEMFATGFTMQPNKFWEDENGPTFQWFKKWSSKLDTCMLGGIITKTSDGKFQNTLLVVYPSGQVEYYHKRHLFRMGEENQHYQSGISQKIINLKGWKVNLQICYDLRFPVFSRNQLINKTPAYDAMIYIANWPQVRAYAWTNLLQTRSIENQAYVVGINRVGKDANEIDHNGASAIIGSDGQYIQESILNKACSFTATLSQKKLVNYRKFFPVLLDSDFFKMTDN